MKKYYFAAVIMVFQFHLLAGQKYFSKTGRIHFLSEASLEKIEATNTNAFVVLDVSNGMMEWSVLIKGFQFKKALMQEHFNENYLESHLYPKGIFKGSILNMNEINLKKDGTYTVKVKGELTLHGVTKPFNPSGLIHVKGGILTAESKFEIIVADFNIEIPKVVRDNVAKIIKVTVGADLQLMK